MRSGYEDGDPIAPVATYTLSDVEAESMVLDVAEDAFRVFNMGHDPEFGVPDQRALDYRAAHNRALSVGDVVQVGDIWLAVDDVGFRMLSVIPIGMRLDAEPSHGTTPIALPSTRADPGSSVIGRERRPHPRTPVVRGTRAWRA